MFFIWQSKGNNFGSYTKKEAVILLPDSDFEKQVPGFPVRILKGQHLVDKLNYIFP